MKRLLLAGLLVFTLSSCKNNVNPEEVIWKLVELNGDVNAAFDEENTFTLKFLSEEGKIGGVGACNRFFGTYSIEEDDDIELKIVGSTLMAGPNVEFERPYFDALESVDEYKIVKGQFHLFSDDKLVAKFNALDIEKDKTE